LQKTGNEKSFVVIEKLVTRQIRARNFLMISPKVFFRQARKGFLTRLTLSGFRRNLKFMSPGFSLRSNPGLKLANAFGVWFLSRVKSVYVKRAFKLINEARDKA